MTDIVDPRLAAWPGFALAADDVVRQLTAQLGLDLWLVTHIEADDQVVVASSGAWSDLAAPGTTLPYAESFCLRMVDRRGPAVSPDVRVDPEYAPVATGVLARVRAYIGVPLLDEDGRLFGTLCAFDGSPQSAGLRDSLGLVRLLGRLLSTIIAREQLARRHSQAAADAYALAERDRLTGVANRRGWEGTLTREQSRCRRYGSIATVLVLRLEVPDDGLLERSAALLVSASRPGDTVARTGSAEFGLLAVECREEASGAVEARMRVRLALAGAPCVSGRATWREGEDLVDTERRAREAISD